MHCRARLPSALAAARVAARSGADRRDLQVAAPFANPLCVALDLAEPEAARALAQQLAGIAGGLKVGLELFTRGGPKVVEQLAATGCGLFLDLKLHDIPNTVAAAVRAIADLPVALTTLHAAGGRAMLEAAVAARDAASTRLRLVAVTVLTSLDDADLHELGVVHPASQQVERLAELALAAGVDGLVCSPREVARLRARFGPEVLLVVPGIRPGEGGDDQKRTATPEAARAAGADVLVVGRPITRAADPAAAARAILRRLGEAG